MQIRCASADSYSFLTGTWVVIPIALTSFHLTAALMTLNAEDLHKVLFYCQTQVCSQYSRVTSSVEVKFQGQQVRQKLHVAKSILPDFQNYIICSTFLGPSAGRQGSGMSCGEGLPCVSACLPSLLHMRVTSRSEEEGGKKKKRTGVDGGLLTSSFFLSFSIPYSSLLLFRFAKLHYITRCLCW